MIFRRIGVLRDEAKLRQQPVEDMEDPDIEHGAPLVEGPSIVTGLGAGIAIIGLMPALPISTESNGIPALEAPPGEVVAGVTVDAGVLLLEAVLHDSDAGALPAKEDTLLKVIPPPS